MPGWLAGRLTAQGLVGGRGCRPRCGGQQAAAEPARARRGPPPAPTAPEPPACLCPAAQVRETNQMVEEMMLLANIAVAEKILRHFPTCSLLRRHQTPAPRQFEPLLRAAAASGEHPRAGAAARHSWPGCLSGPAAAPRTAPAHWLRIGGPPARLPARLPLPAQASSWT